MNEKMRCSFLVLCRLPYVEGFHVSLTIRKMVDDMLVQKFHKEMMPDLPLSWRGRRGRGEKSRIENTKYKCATQRC